MVENSCGCRERERESYTLKKKSAVLFGILTQGNLINKKASIKNALLSIYKTDQLVI